jgi:hypothetical protein
MKRFGALLCGVSLAGCYSLQPVTSGTVPMLGAPVALDINDAGRVVLGGTMGPEIAQIEGRLVSKDNVDYVVSVSVVRFVRGGEQTWTGERIHIKNEFVTSVQEKKFSKGRTAILSAVAVGAVALLIRQALVGSGTGDLPTTPTDTSAQKVRIPWH